MCVVVLMLVDEVCVGFRFGVVMLTVFEVGCLLVSVEMSVFLLATGCVQVLLVLVVEYCK